VQPPAVLRQLEGAVDPRAVQGAEEIPEGRGAEAAGQVHAGAWSPERGVGGKFAGGVTTSEEPPDDRP
jgi:hypothetical protein